MTKDGTAWRDISTWLVDRNLIYTLTDSGERRRGLPILTNCLEVSVRWDPRYASDEEGTQLVQKLHEFLSSEVQPISPVEGEDGTAEQPDLAREGQKPTGSEGLVERLNPALWGVFNPQTAQYRNKVFHTEPEAIRYAKDRSDNYCLLIAAPLFGPEALITVEAERVEAREVVRELIDTWPEGWLPSGPLCVRAANVINVNPVLAGLTAKAAEARLSAIEGGGNEGASGVSLPAHPAIAAATESGGLAGRKYDVEAAKRQHRRGDSAYLIELAGYAEYERRNARTWHLIARGMGYETGGKWEGPAPELSSHVREQIVRQRARVRAFLATDIAAAGPSDCAATGPSRKSELIAELLVHSIAHYGRPVDESHGIGLLHAKARAFLSETGHKS